MDFHEFVGLVSTAPSADNSQPWAFYRSMSTVECRYAAHASGSDPFGPLGHGTLISAGAVHENIVQVVGTEHEVAWALGDDGWSICFAATLLESLTPESATGGIMTRHTNRLPYRRELQGTLPSPQPAGECRVVTLLDRQRMRQLGKCLQVCAEARFNSRELHQWLFSSMRWSVAEAASGDGLDVATLHLPPGGRAFMKWIAPWERMARLNRFGIYKLLASADSRLFIQAPAVVAITGPRTPREVWNAGRTLQRLWIELNQAGFAVQPYYVVTDLDNRLHAGKLAPDWEHDVSSAVDTATRLLELSDDEQIHMLLRVGVPLRAPVRSQRRPPESFISQMASD